MSAFTPAEIAYLQSQRLGRLATVRRVDDIVLLEEGRVVEAGPRDALAADPASRLAALLRAAGPEWQEVLA